jgi:CTP:molybdopterin cytidylyltransferase MocA
MTRKVGALILAAGLSRRMGRPKLAIEIDGAPMLGHSLAAVRAAGLPLLLVTGGDEAAVLAAAPNVPQVHADRHGEGLAQSLKAGLAAAPGDWAAVLVVLGDMPLVKPATLSALAEALAAGAGAVVPVHNGRRGNPAGFARAHWPALLALSGDRGARGELDRLGAAEVPVEDPGILVDIDSPAQLAEAMALLASREKSAIR